jgi:hypothetical protein
MFSIVHPPPEFSSPYAMQAGLGKPALKAHQDLARFISFVQADKGIWVGPRNVLFLIQKGTGSGSDEGMRNP